jgi:hypothetical protein
MKNRPPGHYRQPKDEPKKKKSFIPKTHWEPGFGKRVQASLDALFAKGKKAA